ncbi:MULTISPECIES: peptidoglycan-binding domain-containing protein [Streptomyces]|uniref:peptidoglycan-binding domain-containing protein n=1 Tax=Streptomyces TaxID=1883 RepID=UPI0037CF4F2D
MTLAEPTEPDEDAGRPSPQPVAGVVSPPPGTLPAPGAGAPADGDDTPAYGIPVAPASGPWQDGPWHEGPAQPGSPARPAHPAETMRLRTVPPEGPGGPGTTGGTGGGGWGGGPEGGRPSRRRPLALLLGAAAAVALSGTAVAVWVLPSSTENNAALVDATTPAPASSAAPAAPSAVPSSSGPSRSASASASPSASKSASPSASPSPSRSASASPSPTPSASASRSASPTPVAQAPVLRYGDSGAEVEKLQRLLAAQGLYRGKFNGQFDWRVERALSEFQYDHGLDDKEWGYYGPLTRKALEG